MNESLFGITIGLTAAVMQSLSYVVSGRYVREYGRGAVTLLAPSFTLMGIVSLAVLPFMLPEKMPPPADYILPVFLCVGFCIAGHMALFMMLKYVDASRTSPLLAMKVPILAVFYFFLGDRYSAGQWVGILLVIVAALILCHAGRNIPWRALAWLFAGCVGYSASDHCIKLSFDVFKTVAPDVIGYTLLSVFMIYAAGGLYGVAGLLLSPKVERRVWGAYVVPFSAFWLLAMVLLFTCFAYAGIVQGNIIQSTRGLISVVLGWFIARAGYVNIEEKVPRQIFARRIASALLIILAMVLFNIGRKG